MSTQMTLFGSSTVAASLFADTAYSGASSAKKELASWQPTVEPPDAELLPELGTLVARSRDLGRNHGIASGGFQTLDDNVVGTGLRLAAAPDYRALGRDVKWAEEWSRNVEAQWRSFAEQFTFDAARQMNFHGATRLVFRTVMMSGEVLALPLWLESADSPWATAIQLVEGDRLSNPDHQPDTQKRRGGIEMDEYGRPTAYWLRKVRAEDWSLPSFWGTMPGEWERIPAQTDWGRARVIHMYERERIGQSRGKPLLTSVLEQFKLFDHYQRTELQSSIVNSLVAGIIETPMDQAQIADLMGGDPNSYLARKQEWRTRLQGGAMIPLYPGDKLAPFMPARPATQYPAFVETVLRHIAAALHMPYELLCKDFSKTNYSSARAALLEAWRFFNGRRRWLADYWSGPIYRLWLEEAVAKGKVEAPGFYEGYAFYTRTRWIGAGRGWIDPVKEAQAAQVRLQARISTLEMECAEQGQDWQDVLEQLALEQTRMKLLGLFIEEGAEQESGSGKGAGRSKGGKGGGQARNAEQESDPGEDYGE